MKKLLLVLLALFVSVASASIIPAVSVSAAPLAPTISGFSPASGGTGAVIITGTNFTGATAVSVGSTAAVSYTVNSSTTITAVIGAATTTGTVSVVTSGGTATSSGTYTFNASTPYEAFTVSIPTYDGSGQTVHPSIVYIPGGFGSGLWTYWMAITPYPNGNDAYENPSIYASYDGINWVVPPGLTNPVIPGSVKPISFYNSDPNLEYFNNELYLYYRVIQVASPNPCDISLTTSTNGVTWTTPQVVVSLSDPTNQAELLAPTVILDNGTYKLYYVSFPGSSTTTSYLYMSTSTDGINWSSPSQCTVNGLPSSTPCPWHADIKKNGNLYQCLLCAVQKTGGVGATDYYAYSTDGITWTCNSSPLMVSHYSFDNSLFYKGCMLPDPSYPGLYRIWYSCDNTNTVWSTAYTEGTILNNTMIISSSLVHNSTAAPAPTISGFSPASGGTGTSVTITGTNFTGATAVSFGGAVASSYTVSSSTSITAVVGTGATGVVMVVTPGGTATSSGTFDFLSSDASLSNLTISSGTLTPSFTPGTLTYTDSVANSVTSVTVTPTANQANATIKVNGTTVASGTASGPITLSVGSNTITSVVNAQDGVTTETYTITVTRAAPSDASLSNLTISSGTLTPSFTPGTLTYTDSVANSVTSVTVTPTANQANATIKVNGTTVASGTASGPITLSVGSNTITSVVTAQDGVTTETYTITVTRAAPSDASLSNLTISSGTLTPSFTPGTLTYTDSVANSVTSVTVTPTANQANATIKVNGTTVASGTASGPITLSVGSNTITSVVTAQDGVTTETYTITVTRAAPSDASLSNLTISSGTLTPSFTPGTLTYTDSVANSVTSVTVTPTANQANATIKVNGTTVASGTASGPITLSVGSNTITSVVTAQDGVTTETYTITVTRAAPSDASLSNLTISSGTLTPSFTPGTLTYTDSVANSVTSVTVTPTANQANATIKVNGTTVASGTASGPITLSVGSNTITSVVTAQDGVTTETYTITVTRAAPSDASLSNLTISSGTLTPSFTPGTLTYTDSVANSVTSVTVTPTANQANATIKVNGTTVASGTASGPITLSVGSNTITSVVTAQDGVTTETYTITVTRETV